MSDFEEMAVAAIPTQSRPVRASKRQILNLAKDIEQNGLTKPIILFGDIVIDGLVRLEAVKTLGWEKVPVAGADSFPEVCLIMRDVRGEERPEPARFVEQITDLSPEMVRWTRLRRVHIGAEKRKYSGVGGEFSTRQLLSMATGASGSRVEAMLSLLKQAKSEKAVAERVEAIKRGDETVFGAINWLMRKRAEAEENPLPPAEARGILQKGFRALENTVGTMLKVGSARNLSPEERADILRQIDVHRRMVYNLALPIRTGLEDEEKE